MPGTYERLNKTSVEHKRLRAILKGMKSRCRNPKSFKYYDYGARGIDVCPEWNGCLAFIAWALANGYKQGLQIDRIDNDGPYSPENCRWVTCSQNCNNKRYNNRVVAFDETKTVAEWARDSRCLTTYFSIRQRLKEGWQPETAITTPPKWRA